MDSMQDTTAAAATAESTPAPAPEAGLLDALEIKRWETAEIDASDLDLKEEIVRLNRVAKVVKGGRRFSFAATVVIGNRRGIVGCGKGKARQVPDAISKAVEDAKRHLIRVTRMGRTIPHEIIGEFGSARVLLRPAAEGTGLIAGPGVRAVLDLAGLQDLLTKSLGSSNVINVVKATLNALENLGNAERVARLRGKRVDELISQRQRETLHGCMRESMPRSVRDAGPSVSAMLAEKEAAGAEQFDSDEDASAAAEEMEGDEE